MLDGPLKRQNGALPQTPKLIWKEEGAAVRHFVWGVYLFLE
ncbi:hypothetical protein RB2083_3276 [Rhodobacteraceae bacterium HTCC2083]|nr:hypothetical protein RB2083_3276 [Rhodobacteraceae bacterium HTCC2083]